MALIYEGVCSLDSQLTETVKTMLAWALQILEIIKLSHMAKVWEML